MTLFTCVSCSTADTTTSSNRIDVYVDRRRPLGLCADHRCRTEHARYHRVISMPLPWPT